MQHTFKEDIVHHILCLGILYGFVGNRLYVKQVASPGLRCLGKVSLMPAFVRSPLRCITHPATCPSAKKQSATAAKP